MQTLEQHASDLFDMLNAPVVAQASFDEQRIRSKLQVRGITYVVSSVIGMSL